MKTTFDTNNFSILNWIPRSSRGMTTEQSIHATRDPIYWTIITIL
ncbi:hypothetical protein APHACPA_0628 [Rickettsia amblyommatis str. Ac/Pa]|uniref:Uncharacterized protein n=1 Tax=Rickettsia amblyommatis str. Ac/Pa TaxID=1359164 RepID=A0A0F3N1Q9_RICAM|nr:hypothetical protein APHACPA_0628 [Rickettsia amblyommatis str. Ac/Pa]